MPPPPPPPMPKHRAEEEHGVVTRGSHRSDWVPSRPHGAETSGSSRPHGAETKGSFRPRRDRPDSQELGTGVQALSISNTDGTHRAPKDKAGMSSSTVGVRRAGMSSSTVGVRRAGTSSGREVPQENPSMVKLGMSSSKEMSQKCRAMVKGGMSSQECCVTAKGRTISSREMSQKCLAMVKGGTSSSEMSQKCPVKMKAGTSFLQKNRGPQALRENKGADEMDCTIQELNELALRQKKEADEADQTIQQLNQLGLGEEISHDQYLVYLGNLPCQPPYVDTSTKLHDTQLVDLDIRLALYRLKYAKGEDAKLLKKDCDRSKLLCFLEEQEFFKNFEKDGTLDWSFHPDSYCLASSDDYQRIVPQNQGDFEYVKWDEYRSYFHSYEIENEYVNYCEELAEKLEWMEDYVAIKLSPLKLSPVKRIFTRGAYQATKIATRFPKITWSLASNGYHEFLDDMSFDVCWHKELDGVYFEIWQRITKEKKCFRDALDEVYKLNKFPLRQPRMKYALDTDCSKMEKEFYTCSGGIIGEVADEKAQELIAEAVKQLRAKPKFYVHYIRKKIGIARDIGVIPYIVQHPEG